MRVIKYTQGVQDEVIRHFKQGEAYVKISADSNYILSEGDYVVDYGSHVAVVTSDKQNEIKVLAGMEIMKNIFIAIKDNQTFTDANKHTILKEISYLFTGLAAGKLQQVRDLAAVIPVAAPFTTGVKNYLLGLIDDGIESV
jgi:hypothetical protein